MSSGQGHTDSRWTSLSPQGPWPVLGGEEISFPVSEGQPPAVTVVHSGVLGDMPLHSWGIERDWLRPSQ